MFHLMSSASVTAVWMYKGPMAVVAVPPIPHYAHRREGEQMGEARTDQEPEVIYRGERLVVPNPHEPGVRPTTTFLFVLLYFL